MAYCRSQSNFSFIAAASRLHVLRGDEKHAVDLEKLVWQNFKFFTISHICQITSSPITAHNTEKAPECLSLAVDDKWLCVASNRRLLVLFKVNNGAEKCQDGLFESFGFLAFFHHFISSFNICANRATRQAGGGHLHRRRQHTHCGRRSIWYDCSGCL